MIVISGVLVVLALVLLIAGVLADNLPLIYLSIAASAVSFLSLLFGVRQRKSEVFPSATPVGSGAGGSAHAGASAAGAPRSGGSIALLERADTPAPSRSAPTEVPTLADLAVPGAAHGGSTLVEDRPAAGAHRHDQPGEPTYGALREGDGHEGDGLEGAGHDRPEAAEGDEHEGAEGAEGAVIAPELDEQPARHADQHATDEYADEYDEYEAYEDEASEGVVLVINGRPRYHIDGCRFVAGKDAEAIAVEDAREEGFTACGVCRPDEALAAAAALHAEDEYEDDEYDYEDDEYEDVAVEEGQGAQPVADGAAAPTAGPAELAVVPGAAVGDTPVDGTAGAAALGGGVDGTVQDDAVQGEHGVAYDEYEDEYDDEYDDEEYDDTAYAEAEDADPADDEESSAVAAPVTPAPVHVVAPEPATVAAPLHAEDGDTDSEVDADGFVESDGHVDTDGDDDGYDEDPEPVEVVGQPPAAAALVAPPVGPAPVGPGRVATGGTVARRPGGARPGSPAPRPTPGRAVRPAPAPAAAPSPVPESVPAPPRRTGVRGRVVVIPDRGRYHRPECRYVRESADAVEITKQRATKQGYVPCGVCKP